MSEKLKSGLQVFMYDAPLITGEALYGRAVAPHGSVVHVTGEEISSVQHFKGVVLAVRGNCTSNPESFGTYLDQLIEWASREPLLLAKWGLGGDVRFTFFPVNFKACPPFTVEVTV